MRTILIFIALGLIPSGWLQADQTLYQVLRVAGQQGKLIAAEGLRASPQPKVWRLVYEDGAARGGVREVELSGGAVVMRRTPVKSPFPNLQPVALSQLQLDSDGAFTAAENEAVRRKIGFDAVHFFLSAGDPAGNPVWRIRLLDKADRVLATFFVDARTGLVTGVEGGKKAATTISRPAPVPTATPGDGMSPEQKIHQTMVNTGRAIGDGVKHVGGSLQEIFTGRRTIDRPEGSE